MVGAGVEKEVRNLYTFAGADMSRPPGPLALARAVLGEGKVRVADVPGGRRAVFVASRGELWVSPRLSGLGASFAILHELGEWVLDRAGYDEPDREDHAHAIAAGLLAPAPAVRVLHACHGRDFAAAARALVTTQSVYALRWGTVTRTPTALVSPWTVRVTGNAWGWVAAHALKRLAVSPTLPRDVERRPVTDAPKRTVLVAA